MSGSWTALDAWLIHSAVGGGLLLLLVGVFMRRCRQPARQQRLGEWGVFAALILAGLSMGPAWLVVPLLEPDPVSREEMAIDAAAVPGDMHAEEMLSSAPATPQEADWSALLSPTPSESTDETAELGGVAGAGVFGSPGGTPTRQDAEPGLPKTPAPATQPERPGKDSRLPLGLAYLMIVAFLGGRWFFGHVGLWRLQQSAQAAPEAMRLLFDGMAQGFGRRPRLLVSGRLRAPVSYGLIRPTVMVPSSLCRPEALEKLRWVFAHELTHLQRRDAWTCLLFGLGQALYFYLPWFWWLRRQVRLCQEYIADAAAVQQTTGPEEYAQFLLNLSKAPAVPVGATGVLGNSSDLFRRVTMLLQDRVRVEKGCPGWWSWATAAGLLTAAVLLAGIGLGARANARAEGSQAPLGPPPIKDDSKQPAEKDRPQDPGLLRERVRAMQEEMMQRLQAQQPFQNNFAAGGFAGQQPFQNNFVAGGFNPGQEGRLGILIQIPNATLVDQLDLPKDEGLVVAHVRPGSAAGKAGLKAHDILLEFNGKAVSSEPVKLVRSINELKAGTTVDAVVLRKGKKETVKGIAVPERQAAVPQNPFGGAGAGFGQGGFQQFPGFKAPPVAPPQLGLNFGQAPFAGQVRHGVTTTNFRVDDRFTTRHEEGSLIITVTGTVTDSKVKVSRIQIQDGRESHKYESLAEVPEQYRDKVKNLVELNEKSNIRIEIKTAPEGKK
jgi:hypothetical protein